MINKYYENEHAKVCSGQKCMHVYGDTARVVNGIAIFVSAVIAIALIHKALN